MLNSTTIATAKVIKAASVKAARNEFEAGEYNVDFIAHIFGTFKIGDDYETAPTVAIPYKKAFAALCHVAGCTGPAGVNMIRKAMEIALADDDATATDALQRYCPMIEQVEQDVIVPMLQRLPKLDCKGKVTTKLEIEIQE